MFYKIIVVLAIALIAGCSPTVQTSSNQQGPKESAGALSGMVIGGAIGGFGLGVITLGGLSSITSLIFSSFS